MKIYKKGRPKPDHLWVFLKKQLYVNYVGLFKNSTMLEYMSSDSEVENAFLYSEMSYLLCRGLQEMNEEA